MKWLRVMFQGAKTHVVEEKHLFHVIQDLADRGCILQPVMAGYDPVQYAPVREVTSWRLDLGGLCFADTPMITLGEIDGLALDAPCDQIETLRDQLRLLLKQPVRQFLDGPRYRKAYAWVSCLVLTPDQFETLLARFEAQLTFAATVAADFFAQRGGTPAAVLPTAIARPKKRKRTPR